jgi:myosin protein heavy chain
MNEEIFRRLFLLLICILFIGGCKESTEEHVNAQDEIQKTKAELTRLKSALKKTKSQSDDLNEGFAETLEEFEKIKLELALAANAKDSLQNQVAELTAQRDEALTKVKDIQDLANELTEQLKEKTEEVKTLEEVNEELLKTIDKLQEQINQTSEPVTEEVEEGPYGQL